MIRHAKRISWEDGGFTHEKAIIHILTPKEDDHTSTSGDAEKAFIRFDDQLWFKKKQSLESQELETNFLKMFFPDF